jgi:hypothetical protein
VQGKMRIAGGAAGEAGGRTRAPATIRPCSEARV